MTSDSHHQADRILSASSTPAYHDPRPHLDGEHVQANLETKLAGEIAARFLELERLSGHSRVVSLQVFFVKEARAGGLDSNNWISNWARV